MTINHNHEVRTMPVELRVSDVAKDGYTRTLTGTAIVFNSRSQNLGGFVEVIKPEAVTKSLSGNPDLRLLNNHNSSQVLARSPGTMKLHTDSTGVHYTAMIDTRQSYAADLAVAVERQDVKGNSFGFRVLKDSYSNENGVLVRSVTDMQLLELSVTGDPAYTATTASIRSLCPPELRHLLNEGDGEQDMDLLIRLSELNATL